MNYIILANFYAIVVSLEVSCLYGCHEVCTAPKCCVVWEYSGLNDSPKQLAIGDSVGLDGLMKRVSLYISICFISSSFCKSDWLISSLCSLIIIAIVVFLSCHELSTFVNDVMNVGFIITHWSINSFYMLDGIWRVSDGLGCVGVVFMAYCLLYLVLGIRYGCLGVRDYEVLGLTA